MSALPRKRTSGGWYALSAMCQKRSSAAFGQRAAGEALARPHDAKELGLKFRIICCQRSAVKKAAEYEKHVEECLELAMEGTRGGTAAPAIGAL